MEDFILWCDEWMRLDPIRREVLDGDQQTPFPLPVKREGIRNAFVSFQLSVGPIGRNGNVRVVPAPLRHESGASLSADNMDVYVQWYHNLQGKWYPEICVPQDVTDGATERLRRLNRLPANGFVGFWVDIFIPPDAPAGSYQGALRVTTGKNAETLPVELVVHSWTLGADCCLDASCNNYADAISEGWPDLRTNPDRLLTAKYRRVERGVFRAAHEHRMFLHYLPYGHSGYVHRTFAPPLAGEGPRKRITRWTDWDRHFGGYLDGSAFRGTRRGAVPVKRFYLPLNLCWPADFLKFGLPGYEAEWRAVGNQIVDHFKKKGWTRTRFDMFLNHKQRYRFFPWDTEEIRFKPDNDIHRYFARLWKGTYDRATTAPVQFDYTLGTTWLFADDIQSDFVEFVDVFIGGGSDMAESHPHMEKLHRRGRQLWGCLNSGSTLTPPKAAAFPPLMMWMVDADGYMPWWRTLGSWGEAGWYQPAGNGATTFFYCGSVLGTEDTYVSVRLKVQRNSLQMVDMFHTAAQSHPAGKPGVKKAINDTLGIPDTAWYPTRVADPQDTSRFTEEPPLAGWQAFTADQNRRLRELAITLVAGGAR